MANDSLIATELPTCLLGASFEAIRGAHPHTPVRRPRDPRDKRSSRAAQGLSTASGTAVADAAPLVLPQPLQEKTR